MGSSFMGEVLDIKGWFVQLLEGEAAGLAALLGGASLAGGAGGDSVPDDALHFLVVVGRLAVGLDHGLLEGQVVEVRVKFVE